jgi:hypothetical protein
MAINRWWDGQISEAYWVEITQREDLGADLRAPQENEAGQDYWSYALVREVSDGDIVFHYSMRDHAIRLWSRAAGGWWDDVTHWGARGTVSRSHKPYLRPGWTHGLDGPFQLPAEVTLDDLRNDESSIRTIRDALLEEYGKPLYFPFEISDKRQLRTSQGYLFKLPAAVVNALPALRVPLGQSPPLVPPQTESSNRKLGTEYRRPDDGLSVSARDPFEVDPSVIERGLRGHIRAQNALADHLANQGISPRSPNPDEPTFDLAWIHRGRSWVAEVKSLTKKNEERQLRLGLGQVLRYRELLSQSGSSFGAVLMTEHRPSDQTWDRLCQSLDVLLVWPSNLTDRVR